MKRLPVILDIDASDIERVGDSFDTPFNADGVEAAYFARVRPRDCADGVEPCPWDECRYRIDNPARPEVTCAIDVAEEGPLTTRGVAAILGVSHPRVTQIEQKAIRRAKAAGLPGP